MDGHPLRRLALGVLVLGACSPSSPGVPAPAAGPRSPAVEAPDPGVAAPSPDATPDVEAAVRAERGRALFDDICAQCHTLDPPANQAPPMRHVVRHLRQALDDDDAAVLRHVLSYVPAPAAEHSLLPAMAIERFGVMPPQPLPAELLNDIGTYLLTLDAPAGGRGMGGGGAMRGGHGSGGQCAMHPGQRGAGQGSGSPPRAAGACPSGGAGG